MALRLTSAPATEPISSAELKLQCRIDSGDTSEDTLLAIYIKAARQQAEFKTGRALITQTWEQTLDEFPAASEADIRLLKPQVIAITSVEYIDTDGDLVEMDSADYTLDAYTSPGYLLPAEDTDWPSTDDVINAVTITYTAGFGANASDVPADIRNWILMTAAAMYANREAIDMAGKSKELPNRFYDSLLDPWIVYGV